MSAPGTHRARVALAAAAALAATLGLAACKERPQWTVTVATDAPVPQLGDRLLVDLLDESGQLACTACRRQLGAGEPERWPLSFGVVPSGAPLFVRARLYRADHTGADGLPSGATLLDGLGRLPDGPSGDRPVTLSLDMRCYGVAAAPPLQSCDPTTGALAATPTLDQVAPLAVGSWAAGVSTPCSGEPPEGMVCVPGGAFLLGGPHYFPDDQILLPAPERLVALSPYWLDATEVTVGTARALVQSGQLAEPVRRGADPGSAAGACTWLGPDDAADDALPLNCLGYLLARDLCEALGKRLPSEAEWEYAAGNRDAETTYPWGSDTDLCGHAVIGLGRQVVELTDDLVEYEECRVGADGTVRDWGLVAGGNPLDVTRLGLRDLGGSLSEWVTDAVASYSDPCWSGPLPLVDPSCGEAHDDALDSQAMIRGGAWQDLPLYAAVVQRHRVGGLGAAPYIGVRCARSAR